MADDQTQRPYRSNEPLPRATPAATSKSASDPLAELARLIGQNDPFAEFGRDNARRAAPPPVPERSAPPAAPIYGTADYYAASAAPAEMPSYGTANRARQPYANSPAADELYRAGSETNDYQDVPASGYEADPYQQNQMHQAAEAEDVYDDAPPPRRSVGILAIAAIFGLAVIGTAGAFGYRALFGPSGSSQPPPVIKADPAPSKVVPATASKTPNKLITDRLAEHTQGEKLVSREEQPVEINNNPAAATAPQTQDTASPASNQAALGSGVIASEPKKIRTIAIHPDQAGMGESQPMAVAAAAPALMPPAPAPVKPAAPPLQRAASNAPVADSPEPSPPPPRQTEVRAAPPPARSNAPLSLSPNATAAAPAARAPVRTAAVAAPAPIARAAKPAAAGGSGSYVQLSSQRSEAEAQAAFHGLQTKYPAQLGNRQLVVHKVELGAKGTYYRAMVGPLAGNEATELCTGLKAAGGQCLIQRN